MPAGSRMSRFLYRRLLVSPRPHGGELTGFGPDVLRRDRQEQILYTPWVINDGSGMSDSDRRWIPRANILLLVLCRATLFLV